MNLKKTKEVNDVPSELNMLFNKSIQPYFISWLKYDAQNLHNANRKSKLDIIPLMTHTLKNTDADCKDENNKTYTDPSLPLNKKLINEIVSFIKS